MSHRNIDPGGMRIVRRIDRQKRWARRRERALKTVAVLPSLATLGNLVCGLGAIYLCIQSVAANHADLKPLTLNSDKIEHWLPTFLAMAAYLIVAAMAFDGIDGRLARFTRKTSEFGAQLDSLADVVSFGVAPAILVLCVAHPGDVKSLGGLERAYWRAEWVMAAVYVCCAALRLARFNVENVADESAHMGFRGLPSPGAACALVGLVIFHEDMLRGSAPSWVASTVAVLMPPFALIIGLFMVSRFPYAHLVNTMLRGQRPFRQVVAISILLLVGLVIQFQLTIAIAAAAYALSGPVNRVFQKMRGDTHPALATRRASDIGQTEPSTAPDDDASSPPMRPAV